MGNFEKCTVAMLEGPCSQHVMGNMSQLNQPQSAIIPRLGVKYYFGSWCNQRYILLLIYISYNKLG